MPRRVHLVEDFDNLDNTLAATKGLRPTVTHAVGNLMAHLSHTLWSEVWLAIVGDLGVNPE